MVEIKFIALNGETISIRAKPGQSVKDVAVANDIDGIQAVCGGGASCGTCHVKLEHEWREKFAPPSEMELQMLDFVVDADERSRLSCQLKVEAAINGVVIAVMDGRS